MGTEHVLPGDEDTLIAELISSHLATLTEITTASAVTIAQPKWIRQLFMRDRTPNYYRGPVDGIFATSAWSAR